MNWLDRITFVMVGVIIGIFIASYVTKSPIDTPTINGSIDSLKTINDSIKVKIENLDSIKNAKVIEVSTLDNDSTIKLFYKLVSE